MVTTMTMDEFYYLFNGGCQVDGCGNDATRKVQVFDIQITKTKSLFDVIPKKRIPKYVCDEHKKVAFELIQKAISKCEKSQ